jgi:hypothetical protein
MKKIRKFASMAFAGAGGLIGSYAVVFRVIDLISYQEFKGAALLASGLLGAAFAIEKLTVK